jgi:hypothetical protein
MQRLSNRTHLVIACVLLVGAIVLSPIDMWLFRWVLATREYHGWEPRDTLMILVLAWPVIVAASFAFIWRRLWRAGGVVRRAGLAVLTLALLVAVGTAVCVVGLYLTIREISGLP